MNPSVIEAGRALASIPQKINATGILERSAELGITEKLAYIAYGVIFLGGGVISAGGPQNTVTEIILGAGAAGVGIYLNSPPLINAGATLAVGAFAGMFFQH